MIIAIKPIILSICSFFISLKFRYIPIAKNDCFTFILQEILFEIFVLSNSANSSHSVEKKCSISMNKFISNTNFPEGTDRNKKEKIQ